ncbi:MAG: hypothetical protein ABIZ49_10380 [Opitutaceae bacterium]
MAEIFARAARSEPPPALRGEVQPVATPRVQVDRPTNEIIRLPEMIVRERKLPSLLEVNKSELARRAMEHYLGPENGFDRGFLNLFTSAQIPIFALFGSVSNEARAMALYREEENRRLKEYFRELAAVTTRSGDFAQGAKLKQEAEHVFRRK